MRGEPLERAGKLGLREHAPGLGLVAAAQVVAGEFAAERRMALDRGRMFVGFVDIELDQRKTVTRKRCRRRQRIAERLPAVCADQFGPACEVTRHADRERSARQILTLAEALGRKTRRHARHEVEHPDALLRRDPAGRKARTREPRHVGLDHIERGGGRGRSIERIAAIAEHPRAGLRGERMRRRNDTLGR